LHRRSPNDLHMPPVGLLWLLLSLSCWALVALLTAVILIPLAWLWP